MSHMRAITILLLLVLLMAGCSRKVRVHDTLYVNRLWRDSVARLDSVVVERRGDTVFKTAWRDRYRLLQRVDTLRLTRRDTVVRTRTVTIRQPAARARRGASWPAWLVLAALAAISLPGLWRGCRGSR